MGYGLVWNGELRREIGAHRAAWWLAYGELPTLDVCHSCDNRRCVNPRHLFLGTHDQNMADMVAKRRSTFGERHPKAELTEEDVLRVLASNESHAELGRQYGVSGSCIHAIRAGITWRHVTRTTKEAT